VDNDGQGRNFVLPKDAELTATFEPKLLGGVVVVRGEASAVTLDKDEKLTTTPVKFQAVPYCVWDNREPGTMVVWLAEKKEAAVLGPELGVLSNGVRVMASHCWQNDTVTALNDDKLPKASNDHGIPRMTWWDRRGTTEWVSYRFKEAKTLTSSSVYWFDDTGVGACRVPAEWRLLYLDGNEWKPVKVKEGSNYGTALDKFNEVEFEPVTTRELKLEVKLNKDVSGGILEWAVREAK
jgi:hypothetical protein